MCLQASNSYFGITCNTTTGWRVRGMFEHVRKINLLKNKVRDFLYFSMFLFSVFLIFLILCNPPRLNTEVIPVTLCTSPVLAPFCQGSSTFSFFSFFLFGETQRHPSVMWKAKIKGFFFFHQGRSNLGNLSQARVQWSACAHIAKRLDPTDE